MELVFEAADQVTVEGSVACSIGSFHGLNDAHSRALSSCASPKVDLERDAGSGTVLLSRLVGERWTKHTRAKKLN